MSPQLFVPHGKRHVSNTIVVCASLQKCREKRAGNEVGKTCAKIKENLDTDLFDICLFFYIWEIRMTYIMAGYYRDFLKTETLKALSHDAILLATCNAILLLSDVKLANTRFHCILRMYSSNIKHSSLINIS